MENECKGCININQESFPFGRSGMEGVYYIDTEGCGLFDSVSACYGQGLIIKFCPVCGRKLSPKL